MVSSSGDHATSLTGWMSTPQALARAQPRLVSHSVHVLTARHGLSQTGESKEWLAAERPLLSAGKQCGMLMRMIEVRALTAGEWRLWRELRLAALAEAPQAFGSTLADWQDAGEDRWRDRLGIPGAANFVAVLDGQPAGVASGVPGDAAGSAELISMWVSPQVRGHGVGDRLVGAVEQWASRRGRGAAADPRRTARQTVTTETVERFPGAFVRSPCMIVA
jgi:GNAT superfamily N-acetyltransferase